MDVSHGGKKRTKEKEKKKSTVQHTHRAPKKSIVVGRGRRGLLRRFQLHRLSKVVDEKENVRFQSFPRFLFPLFPVISENVHARSRQLVEYG
jgi:hypothetical protein